MGRQVPNVRRTLNGGRFSLIGHFDCALGNPIELSDRRLLVDAPEHRRNPDEQRRGGTATEDSHVGGVAQVSGVDRFAVRPADVLLG